MSNMRKKKDGKIRDVDIRLAFMSRNIKFFERDGMEFVNEFGINKTNICDLASFDFNNNIFYGFEIKSEMDNTKRLYKQLNAYISFFNFVYVICYKTHTEDVFDMLDHYDYFDRVGVIEVDEKLNFKELRKAKKYNPVYSMFISNMDLEDLREMAAKFKLPPDGNKTTVLGRLRRYMTPENIYEGIHDKLRKYYIRTCPNCGSKLYYKTGSNRGGIDRVCFKCKHRSSFKYFYD
jgi:hypothetical protein